jgi:non-reducing end alpha-L-arabinofuranosidase
MALLAMLLATAPTWSASAPVAPLVSSASGRCLDVKGNVDTLGTALDIWDCNGQANQAFEFTASGELRTMSGSRCVDAYDNRTAPGTAVVIWSCDGRPNQMWRQNSDGSITGVRSGLCLDVNGAGTANGTAVILWTCNGQTNQKWSTSTSPPLPSGSGPCDIYSVGGTPCVAAHSTVRALYGSYDGTLYQVRRSSDNATRDIGVLAPGGFADAAAQDSFCAGTSCVITVVRD